nr:hypothetical protein [Kibdelosporangium sp. MJ126-NF4]CEL17015.1 hypothetical protein [Kibdelosporangium sp. MJ126-NF4]CTQ91755.1 hypothetical protein [Kibdelosporangium sp. MJ126-NF4]
MVRYTLPDTPIAAATADIGHVAVELELTLTGQVTVDGPFSSADLATLNRISEGVVVSRLDTESPSVTCPAGHHFTQRGTTFLHPVTMVFHGSSVIDFGYEQAVVTGEVDYRLAVKVSPHNREPEPHVDPDQWYSRNGGTLASIGAIVLISRSFSTLDGLI